MTNDPFNSFYNKYNEINKLIDGDTTEKSFFKENNEDTQPKNNSIDEIDMVSKLIRDNVSSLGEVEKQYNNEVSAGDILGVNRGFYEHYGIYLGNNKVIHYTSRTSDISSNNEIMITDFSHFLRNETEFFTIDFDKLRAGMKQASVVDEFFGLLGMDTSQIPGLDYKIYSGKETIQRIKSRLGEREYDLTDNNCEHIAMWAKTGISECNQILTKKYRTSHQYPFNEKH